MQLIYGDIKIAQHEIDLFFEKFQQIKNHRNFLKSTWENPANGRGMMCSELVPARTIMFKNGNFNTINTVNLINVLRDPQIKEIAFTSMLIDESVVINLEVALHNKDSLQAIYFNNCSFNSPNILKNICEILKTCKELDTVVFNSSVHNVSLDPIFNLVKMNQSVNTVYLNNNEIADEHIPVVAKTLKFNLNLKKLYLADNQICGKGAFLLAQALKSNNTLIKLSLKNNYIGNEGALHFSEALKANKSLFSLNLKNNGIRSPGTTALIKCLPKHPNIERFDLSGNNIIDGEIALEHLWQNYSIITMENNLSPFYHEQISPILHRNFSFRNIKSKVFDSLVELEKVHSVTKLPELQLLFSKFLDNYPSTKAYLNDNFRTMFLCLKALAEKRPCDILHMTHRLEQIPSLYNLFNNIILQALLMPKIQEIIPANQKKNLLTWIYGCISEINYGKNQSHRVFYAKTEILDITAQYISQEAIEAMGTISLSTLPRYGIFAEQNLSSEEKFETAQSIEEKFETEQSMTI